MLEDDVMADDVEQAAEVSGDKDFFLTGRVGMLVSGIWMFRCSSRLSSNGISSWTWAWLIRDRRSSRMASRSPSTEHPKRPRPGPVLTASEIAARVRIENSWELPALDKPEYRLT